MFSEGVGHGSTFNMTLPMVRAPPTEPTVGSPAQRAGAGAGAAGPEGAPRATAPVSSAAAVPTPRTPQAQGPAAAAAARVALGGAGEPGGRRRSAPSVLPPQPTAGERQPPTPGAPTSNPRAASQTGNLPPGSVKGDVASTPGPAVGGGGAGGGGVSTPSTSMQAMRERHKSVRGLGLGTTLNVVGSPGGGGSATALSALAGGGGGAGGGAVAAPALRLLVVDDSGLNRKVTRCALETSLHAC